MPTITSKPSQEIVVLDYSDNKIRLNYVSFEKFKTLTLEERQKITKEVIEYLESIPGIPLQTFKNSGLEYVTVETLNHLISQTYANFGPSYTRREAPRMPTEVCINWIKTLQNSYNTLVSTKLDNPMIAQQLTTVKQVLEAQKLRWMKHDLSIEAMKASLKNDSKVLSNVGLNDLADFAYQSDDKQISLYKQLPTSDSFSPIATRLYENIYGAVFETFWINNLIKAPTDSLLKTMGEMGQGLNIMLTQMPSESIDKFIVNLNEQISANKRPWHQNTPEIQKFLLSNDTQNGFNHLKSILKTEPKNGYDAILIPYLAQKIYLAYKSTVKKYPSWMQVTETNMNMISNIQLKSNRQMSGEPVNLTRARSGLTMWHQPFTGTEIPVSSPTDRPLTSSTPDLHHSHETVKTSLENGISYVKGISGTTNMLLGMLAYFKTDLNLAINIPEALLGTIMFLTHDGGHSIHEALWTVNQRELTHKNKYLQHNLPVSSRKSEYEPINNFVSDYEQFKNLYKDFSLDTYNGLTSAYNNAWEMTLNYFDQHSYYSKLFEATMLVKAIKKDRKIALHLEKMLGTAITNKSKLILANELKYLITEIEFHEDANDSSKDSLKDQTLNIVEGIIKKEQAQVDLLKTMKTFQEFDGWNEKNIWRLVIDHYQQETRGEYGFENESGFASSMFKAFGKMLREIDTKLTADYLLELHDTAIDDVLKMGYTWPKFNSLPAWLKEASKNEYFLTKGYRGETMNGFALTVETPNNIAGRHNTTMAGFRELLRKSQQEPGKHFTIRFNRYDKNNNPILDQNGDPVPSENGKIGELWTSDKYTAEQNKERAQKIIDAYYEEINRANTTDTKLLAIANLCHELESAHLFVDGNARTIGVLLVNKLLIQNGFNPAILTNPNATDGFLAIELAEEIKKGQVNFQKHTTSNNELPPQTNGEVEKITNTTFEKLVKQRNRTYSNLQAEYEKEYLNLETQLLKNPNKDFLAGANELAYKTVEIPEYTDSMSLFEMHALALSGKLNQTQLGALTLRIKDVNQEKSTIISSSKELDRNNYILKDIFSAADASPLYKRPASQRILLSPHKDTLGGLCYALTWTMAIALTSNGETGANHFINKLYEAGKNLKTANAILLKEALNTFHIYANNSYIKRSAEQKKQSLHALNEVFDQLNSVKETTMYELSTPNHSMLIGVVFHSNGHDRKFYFYDPETCVVAYQTASELSQALTSYLTKVRLAKYGIFTESSPIAKFELVPINTHELADKRIILSDLNYLTPTMLSKQENLIDQANFQKAQTTSINKAIGEMNADNNLYISLSALNQTQIAKNFFEATTALNTKEKVSDLIILLHDVKRKENGSGYILPFLDPVSKTICWVETNDETFIKTKQYVEQQTDLITKSHDLTDNFHFNRKSDIAEVHGIDGMNAAFTLQQLISWFYTRNRSETSPIAKNLAIALTIHSYVNTAQIAQGNIQDVTTIANMVSSLLSAKQSNSFSSFSSALNHFGSGLGIVLNSMSVGLDFYELFYAENKLQKAVFGTQLGFDSAGLVLSGASIGASVMGYSTVSGILGPLGVVVSGIGVGAAGLAQAYGEFAQDTDQVASYFVQVNNAYQQGYSYNSNEDMLTPLTGGVIKTLDLETGTIEFDSQNLYASDYSSIAFVDQTTDNGNRNQVINMREAINPDPSKSNRELKLLNKNAKTVVLPNTPKSYINYYSQKIIGFKKEKGEGYDILRRVEKNSGGHFKFEHFFFPFDSIVRSIAQEYTVTNIDIKLGDTDRILLVPELPTSTSGGAHDLYRIHSLSNIINYKIIAKGGQHFIGLNEGAMLSLFTQTESKPSHWILDTHRLKSDTIEIVNNKLIIGDVTVVNNTNCNNITIIKHNGETCEINFNTKSLKITGMDASQWFSKDKKSIETYLNQLAKEHHLSGQYILIQNYIHNGQNVGNGYYDVKNDRILYTQPMLTQQSVISQLNTLVTEITSKPLITIIKKTVQPYLHLDIPFKQVLYSVKLTQPEKLDELIELCTKAAVKVDLKSPKDCLDKQINEINERLNYYLFDNFKTVEELEVTELPSSEFGLAKLAPKTINTLTKNNLSRELNRINNLPAQMNTFNTNLKDAKLGGVLGDDAYFYNEKEGLIWQVDVVTGQTKKQYHTYTKGKMRVWQSGEQIYAAIEYTYGTTLKGEEIYSIQNDCLELLSFCGNGFLASLEASNNDLLNQYSYFPDVEIIKPNMASLVSVFEKENPPYNGVYVNIKTSRYWISSDKNGARRISINLPDLSDEQALNLTFVGSMTQEQGPEIFYFFDSIDKKLYRQEGIKSTTPKPVVKSIGNEKIVNVQTIGSDLFAVSVSGFLYQVEVTGQLSLKGINEQWLNNQGENWYQNLQNLNSSSPITIFGLKNTDKVYLPAWYYDKKLVIAPTLINSSSIAFLGFDQAGCARLFDAKEGKIYKQKIATENQLNTAFKNNFVLDSSHPIEASVDLLPSQQIKSVSQNTHLLQLITDKGVILSLDFVGTIRLVGVNQEWQVANSNNLDAAMATLASEWNHGSNIVLESGPAGIPTWYCFNIGRLQAQNLTANDNPEFIGNSETHFFINTATKGLQSYNLKNYNSESVDTMSTKVSVKRFDTSLLMKGTDANDTLKTLPIHNVDSIVMSGGEGQDIYQITVEARKKLKKIIIDNYAKDKLKDIIQLAVTSNDKLMLSRMDDDLLIADENGIVAIKKVFGEEKYAYDHLTLVTQDSTSKQENMIADLSTKMLTSIPNPIDSTHSFYYLSSLDNINILSV